MLRNVHVTLEAKHITIGVANQNSAQPNDGISDRILAALSLLRWRDCGKQLENGNNE
jgi:hypothetical protein